MSTPEFQDPNETIEVEVVDQKMGKYTVQQVLDLIKARCSTTRDELLQVPHPAEGTQHYCFLSSYQHSQFFSAQNIFLLKKLFARVILIF